MIIKLNLGYISSVIIKSSIFFSMSHQEYWKFIDYGFSFMYAVYVGIVKEGNQFAYISSSIVCNRSGNSGAFDWCKYIVEGSSLIFNSLQSQGYSRYATRYAKHKVLMDFILPNMIFLKLRDDYDSLQVLGKIYQWYKKDWMFWLACVPAWLIPVFLVRFARKVVRLIRYS